MQSIAVDANVRLPETINDEAIAVLDEAAKCKPIDDDLLQVVNRQALKRQIIKTVEHLRALELETLLSRQSWLARFTGAALEEHMKFEIAAQQVSSSFSLLERLSADSTKRVQLMRQERDNLAASLAAMERAISFGQTLLAAAPSADDFVRSRFESKLANLVAMRSANEMAIQQFRLAEKSLTALNDRFQQISNVLFPLWQQRLFAVLHAEGKLTRGSDAVTNFKTCHEALEEYFVAEANQ